MPTSINEPSTPSFEEIAGSVKPVVTALVPDNCVIGDPDFVLYVEGTGFTSQSEIWFAGHAEPTSLGEDGRVSTGVKPSLWGSPAVVKCGVHTGTQISNMMDFSFTGPTVEDEAEAEASSRNVDTGRYERRR
jgi:hypothetical protein